MKMNLTSSNYTHFLNNTLTNASNYFDLNANSVNVNGWDGSAAITTTTAAAAAAADDDMYIPYKYRPETYFVPVVFFIIFVVGVLGNGTLVVIFLRHRTMRNVPNTYILSLAMADLLVIVTTVPFTSTVYTVESWPWGELICKLSETGKEFSIGVSVFTLTALSADRFFAIVDPLKKFHTGSGGRKAKRITLCIASSIWILALLCSIPSAIGSHIRLFTDDRRNVTIEVCYPYPEDWFDHNYPKMLVMGRFLCLYIIPLAIIGIFYLGMATYLFTSTKNVPGEMQGMQRQIKARKKVAITVLLFVLVFAICFLPYHTFFLFFYFNPRSTQDYNAFWHYLRILGFCLCYMNSCANPVALYFVSGAFRKHFNRYLLCIKSTSHSRCNTCHDRQHATSMSLISTKRNQSIYNNRKSVRGASINLRRPDNGLLFGGNGNGSGGGVVTQETSITLLGNGDGHLGSKI